MSSTHCSATCSQLSSTTNPRPSPKKRAIDSAPSAEVPSAPTILLTSSTTDPVALTPLRSMNHTPSG